MKLVWGIYFILTSVYCLLAYLPYTYYALIKAPAYEWMPWFVHHHVALYWTSLLAAGIAFWPRRTGRGFLLTLSVLLVAGIGVTLRPFMPGLQNNASAYTWSLLALAPLVCGVLYDVLHSWSEAADDDGHHLFAYSSGILAAVMVALLYVAGAQVRIYSETRSFNLHFSDIELTGWSLISHIVLAIIVLTILNLVRLGAKQTSRPAVFREIFTGLLVFAGLWFALVRFLENGLSFEGWQAQLYAASLAASLTLLGFSVASPFLPAKQARPQGRRWALLALSAGLALLALALPLLIHNSDWNGVLEATFTLAFWLALGVCIYGLRPRWASYSIATVAAVLLLAGFSYKALQYSAIFWAKPLGSTDDDISRTMESYAGQDASFQLAHYLLGNSRTEACADLCRILREYTNIRDARAQTDVQLVDRLVPITSVRPNIFLFVLDSVRPDYLGAYNPKVDFTPNLDAFARDSITLHRAFTQYSGTTLSEPAIWSGVMLLHTHYLQPFSKVNGLEKLAQADGYQMVVSYDTVLSQLLSASAEMIKLDLDKPLWNRFEVCSTIQQAEQALDARADQSRPVLFYAQPMNVHQFAHNDLPMASADNWRMRQGFNNRIAHEVHQVDACLGQFFTYLKSRGMYDNSIIVVTSDHGDATGQFGRFSHSVSLYPEIMRVPLLVHLPPDLRRKVVYDDSRISTLTDITPSLYELLGHGPVRDHPLFGRPLFAGSKDALDSYRRDEFFLASDVRAAYGILTDNGRFLYFTFDSPPESYLYDLEADQDGERNIITPALKQRYDQRIIEHLHQVADFYGYKPGVGSLLAASK